MLSSANATVNLDPGEQEPVVLLGHSHAGKEVIPAHIVASWSFSKAKSAWVLMSVKVVGHLIKANGQPSKNTAERQALSKYSPEPVWADDTPNWLKTLVLCHPPHMLGR